MAREAPQPLFHGVTRQLLEKIETGEFAAGGRLPSERWLEAAMGVSRTTVHRAIAELVADGALEARGRAVFVAAETGAAPASTLLSFTEMARQRGFAPSSKVIKARVRPADWAESEALKIAPGADLFELRRVRYLDGAAIGTDHDRVPLKLLPDALQIDFATASFFASLSAAGQTPVTARLQLEARLASDGEREQLDLKPPAAVLVSHEETLSADARVLSLGCTVYRSDRHRFLATFRRSAARP